MEVSIERSGGVAIVTINNPPVNAVSHAVRSGIVEAIKQANEEQETMAVVLICEGSTFIAGADIREFGKVPQPPLLPDVVLALENAQKPWVAAIHGTALGGGLEIALGCHYRVASSNAKMGLPEVNLGLIPGAGGTVRLPRCIPMPKAIEMITTGKPIGAVDANNHGLVHAITEDNLLTFAVDFAGSIAQQSLPAPLTSQSIVAPLTQSELDDALARIKRKAKGQQSPVTALETLRDVTNLPFKEALAIERSNFQSLQNGDQSKALRHIFFAERATSKLPEINNVSTRSLSHIGIIGGGTMGAGIAVACLLKGFRVTLLEVTIDASNAGRERVEGTLAQTHKRGLIPDDKLAEIHQAFSNTIDYGQLSDTDLVIEAVFEDMEVKKSVFKKLDLTTGAEAILASNTSYLDVNQIARVVSDPSRVIGLHFFSPAHIMKLVEIIKTDNVANDVLATAFKLAKTLSKTPVLSGVCDGFIGNRIMSAYRREADYLVEDGASPDHVDQAMREFGFPMGVFEMQDLAGLDISWAMRKRRAATGDPDERYVRIADRLCEMERFGKKTGKGWYNYECDTPYIDGTVSVIINEERHRHGTPPIEFSTQQIMDRILNTMQSEGQTVLDEGVARSADDIDVVMTSGYGFPRWRGGPMFMHRNQT